MDKLTKLSIFALLLIVAISCDDTGTKPVTKANADAPEITSPQAGSSFMLQESQAKDTLFTMEWTKPDFGFSSAPTYTIEVGAKGNKFKDPIKLGNKLQKRSVSLLVGDFNNMLISNDFAAKQPHPFDVRVKASISDSVNEVISDPIDLTFTPYLVEISYPKVYVPGSYQGSSGYKNDWEPKDAPPLFSINSDDKYVGYVNMANSGNEFKITKDRSFDKDWGTNGTSGELFDGDGEQNLSIADAGYYQVSVNLNDLTYSLTDTQWGLIGSATANGWGSDTDMTYDKQSKVWTITTDLTAGEIKFRANDAWDIGYGDANGDGRLGQEDDNNITIEEAGNYTITLDLSKAPFTYELTQN